jgi:GntR family transcriptional repressor for pyruvate dehydrogenase complex
MEKTVSFELSKIKRNPLYEQVYDSIIQGIVDQGLAAGTQIPSERSLSEQYGVSRVVIREAMKVLVKNGIVVVEPGRGSFISDQTNANLHKALDLVCRIQGVNSVKVMEVRIPLEILAARLAAQRATKNDIKAIKTCIEECEKSVNDTEQFIIADEKFHLALAEASKNELLIALIQPLINLIQIVRLKTAGLPNAAISASHLHRKVYEAIKKRDVIAADRAMQEHMNITAGYLSEIASKENELEVERLFQEVRMK